MEFAEERKSKAEKSTLPLLHKELGWHFKVILRPKEDTHKIVVLLLRWIVERTFSWIENYRRMTINKERCSESAEAMLYLTFCHILLKKSTDKFKTASQNTM